MDGDFKKIRQDNCVFYIRKQFLNSGFVQVLLSGEEKLRESYDLKIIPSSEFTRIYRFRINIEGVDREVYLKQFFHGRTSDFIRVILRGSRVKRALEAELMLARNHFDVPETIAIGEYRSRFFHTRSFSATFGIGDSKSVYQFICETMKLPQRSKIFLATEDTEKNEKVRREMIRAFGKTIGRMHASNIFHGDLRLNNVLLRREGSNWRFFFLDNERTRKFNKLPFRCLIKNLVQINMVPAGVLGKTDRMRFFREYRAKTGTGREAGKALITAILRKTVQRIDTRERSRTKIREALRTGAGYMRIEAGDYRGTFDSKFWGEAELSDFIANLEGLIRAGQIIREEQNSIISRIKWIDREIVVKQYVPGGLVHSLKNTIWKSPAKQDWLNGHRLKMPNTAANKPLAYIERRKSGLVWKSYFLTEYDEGAGNPTRLTNQFRGQSL